jgi:CRP-like cAMP-binding protein
MYKGSCELGPTMRDTEVDCAACVAMSRCWSEPVSAGGEFTVRRQSLKRGELLTRQGEKFDAIYLLAEGCVSLREISVDGTERITAFRTPGELIGIEGWKSGLYSYTAEPITPAAVCRLKRPGACGAENGEPQLTQQVLEKTIAQLQESSLLWAGRSAADRVAAFVSDFARRMGQQPNRLQLPMTRAQIGSYLGLSEETVVRSLKQLRLHASQTSC